MLEESDYEKLRDSFLDSKRLFKKLAGVIDNLDNLEYDESGLYVDDEEMYKRHWLKLASKIVDGLSDTLNGYSIELLENKDFIIKELRFRLLKDSVKSQINVIFSDFDSLKIIQIS